LKSITTLITDIYQVLEARDGNFSPEIVSDLSSGISSRLHGQLGERPEGQKATLRLSAMGPKCPKALWYSIHHPELAEPLPPWVIAKFSFGHILEAFGIALCKAAGHTVTGEQDELWVDGVAGHRDAVVDGCIVDFKSCNSRSFEAIKRKQMVNDPFLSSYLDQMDGYLVGSLEDPLVTVKDKGYIFAIDKTLGHCCLYEHRIREDSIRERIKHFKQIVARDTAPHCTCGTVKDGESGNYKLDLKASYSAYKYCCFPGLRTFLYAGGPRYLTAVIREPKDVREIDKEGNTVYH
jgi:hypothetical protein